MIQSEPIEFHQDGGLIYIPKPWPAAARIDNVLMEAHRDGSDVRFDVTNGNARYGIAAWNEERTVYILRLLESTFQEPPL